MSGPKFVRPSSFNFISRVPWYWVVTVVVDRRRPNVFKYIPTALIAVRLQDAKSGELNSAVDQLWDKTGPYVGKLSKERPARNSGESAERNFKLWTVVADIDLPLDSGRALLHLPRGSEIQTTDTIVRMKAMHTTVRTIDRGYEIERTRAPNHENSAIQVTYIGHHGILGQCADLLERDSETSMYILSPAQEYPTRTDFFHLNSYDTQNPPQGATQNHYVHFTLKVWDDTKKTNTIFIEYPGKHGAKYSVLESAGVVELSFFVFVLAFIDQWSDLS